MSFDSLQNRGKVARTLVVYQRKLKNQFHADQETLTTVISLEPSAEIRQGNLQKFKQLQVSCIKQPAVWRRTAGIIWGKYRDWGCDILRHRAARWRQQTTYKPRLLIVRRLSCSLVCWGRAGYKQCSYTKFIDVWSVPSSANSDE